jgi:hypothetical protein
MVVTPSSRHLSITFSNQRFNSRSPTVDVGFGKLTLISFYGHKVVKMNIQFCCPVTCAAVVPWFFEAIFLSVRRSFSVSVDFRPQFRFADVVFPWIVRADISLETLAFDTLNNVAIFITDSSAKRAPTISSPSKSEFRIFHMDCQSTQSLMHWHEHYRV